MYHFRSAAEQDTGTMRGSFIPAGSPLMSGTLWHILCTRSSALVPWNGLLPVGGNNVKSILSPFVQSAEEEEVPHHILPPTTPTRAHLKQETAE